jgi:hypothetical protein
VREILVVANRTICGQHLLDAMLAHAAERETSFRFIVPATKPSSGLIVYDDAVRDSAQARVDLAASIFADAGLQASGEVADPDPFMAIMDSLAEARPERIIISTHPATHSGWLRRDLIERVRHASGLPVEHVVTDVQAEGLPFHATLVIANKTSSGDELIEHLAAKAAEDSQRHVYIAVVPLEDGSGAASERAQRRLGVLLGRLHERGLVASGMIGDPDPYTAVMNALELFTVVNDIVISTLPGERSGWMRAHLVERVRSHARIPVEHVVGAPPRPHDSATHPQAVG